nr:fibroblast growth factor receptor 4 [Crassostrea gigas]
MKSFCKLSCTLLLLCGCLFMLVDSQRKNKGTSRSLVITQNTTVMEGQRVVLICRTPNNDSDATLQWIKRVSGSTNFIQSIGRELVIESAKVADTGKYVCMVGNNIGMKMKSVDVWLTVKGTTTSTTTTTTTKPPTTTTTSTTTTAGLKIRMFVVHYI